jgi:hypothetical protein
LDESVKVLTLDESIISNIKLKCDEWVNNMMNEKMTYTKLGSISYLLYGSKPSEQSINIKMGYLGEFFTKEIIKMVNNFELLQCGIQKIEGGKKDIDLLFIDINNNIIYYRELKGNIELDTEKLEATSNKCKVICDTLKKLHPNKIINYGILNWSIYNRKILKAGLLNIKKFEKNGVKIDHMEDFLKILNIKWTENDFYQYFRSVGDKITNNF